MIGVIEDGARNAPTRGFAQVFDAVEYGHRKAAILLGWLIGVWPRS
jgi:hypothetical protein